MAQIASSPRYDMAQLYKAARLYYLDEATQAEVAAQLKVSRPTVSRLLSEARRLGIVEIKVHDPAEASSGELTERLRDALGLQRVWLAPYTGQDLGLSLSEPVTAALRGAGLHTGDTLLVSSGRTLFELSRHDLPHAPGIDIVPTVGGASEPEPWYQTNEITRAFAERMGGRPHFLFAQAMPSPAMRASLDADPTFQEILALWGGAKAAIVGIGAPPAVRDSISAFIPRGRGELHDAVGDICLNFYAPDGRELTFPGADRMVRTPLALLRQIPYVVAVAVGEEKVHSITAGARAHLFNRLVTDAPTARLIVAELERELTD